MCCLYCFWWFFDIIEVVWVCIFDVVIMIDIIVGFLGEIDEDFEVMLDVVC